MTVFSDLARRVHMIINDADNDWTNIGDEQLFTMLATKKTAVIMNSGYLVHRLGNNVERANLEIRRARDLPPCVLKRRFQEAAKIIEANGEPNIPQHAAIVAVMLHQLEDGAAMLERRQAGAALN